MGEEEIELARQSFHDYVTSLEWDNLELRDKLKDLQERLAEAEERLKEIEEVGL